MNADGFSYCPQCGAEYRAGFTHCAECRVGLVDRPPDRDARDPVEEVYDGPIVELTRLPSRFEADVIVAKLRDAGVRVVMDADDVGGVYPGVGFAQGHRIFIAEDDLALADEILGPTRRTPHIRRRRRSPS